MINKHSMWYLTEEQIRQIKEFLNKSKNPCEEIPLGPMSMPRKPKLKCECGGEKAKTTHSDWCPKYEMS